MGHKIRQEFRMMAKMSRKRSPRASARQRRIRKRQAERRRQRITTLVLLLALASVLAFTAYNHFSRPPAATVSAARIDNQPFKGPEDAPVTITEFGDFGCPACRQWHLLGFFDQIQERYGDQVRFVWRDFPVISPPYSVRAAEAGQCAHDQGRFWEFHDLTFERESSAAIRDDDLRAYAAGAGLDMQQFNQCFDSGQHRETVDFDERAAFGLGLRGTPSFLINGQRMAGPDPNLMIQMIDAELAASQ